MIIAVNTNAKSGKSINISLQVSKSANMSFLTSKDDAKKFPRWRRCFESFGGKIVAKVFCWSDLCISIFFYRFFNENFPSEPSEWKWKYEFFNQWGDKVFSGWRRSIDFFRGKSERKMFRQHDLRISTFLIGESMKFSFNFYGDVIIFPWQNIVDRLKLAPHFVRLIKYRDIFILF